MGLPSDDDMGNSEVGHNAIGCGQIYSQGAKLVNESIESGKMYKSNAWKEVIDKDPNCTDEGAKHQECSVCGLFDSSYGTKVITALGHDYQWVDDPDSTCTTLGTAYHRCSRGGAVDDSHSIGFKPHQYVQVDKQPDTGAGSGYIVYYECSVCGHPYSVHED